MKTPRHLLESLIQEGLGQRAMAARLGVTKRSVAKALERENLVSPGTKATPTVSEDILRECFQKGWGATAICKVYGGTPANTHKRMRRLGLHDPSRINKPSGKHRRKVRLKSQEFTDGTKKQRFLEEHGTCQECHRPIGDGLNFRLATYHHIIQCRHGGTRDPDNCMVLHPECHDDPIIFERLHGFKRERLERYARRTKADYM